MCHCRLVRLTTGAAQAVTSQHCCQCLQPVSVVERTRSLDSLVLQAAYRGGQSHLHPGHGDALRQAPQPVQQRGCSHRRPCHRGACHWEGHAGERSFALPSDAQPLWQVQVGQPWQPHACCTGRLLDSSCLTAACKNVWPPWHRHVVHCRWRPGWPVILVQPDVTTSSVVRGIHRMPACSGSAPAATLRSAMRVQAQLRDQDKEWGGFLTAGARLHGSFQPHSAAAEDTINILFSSGTTGACLLACRPPLHWCKPALSGATSAARRRCSRRCWHRQGCAVRPGPRTCPAPA